MTGREKAEAASLHPAAIFGASEVRADVRMDGVYFFRSSADHSFALVSQSDAADAEDRHDLADA